MSFTDSALFLIIIAAASFGLSYLGASVGLVLGHLRLSLLVYWIGSPSVAAGTSLAISAAGSLVGFYRHARDGRVSIRLLATIGLPSAVASFLAARTVASLDPLWVRGIIGFALLLSGVYLFVWKGLKKTGDGVRDRPPVVAEICTGGVIGALAGTVGLMLGSLRLPVMIRLLRVDPHTAVGTNMAIGCITGILGAIGTLTTSGLSLVALAVVGPTTVAGAYLGARTTGRMRKDTLRRMVGLIVAAIGVWMVIEAIVKSRQG